MKIIATGLQFPEGPIAMPDGSILLVEIARETLSRVRPDGKVDVVAKIPGGPNGAAIGPDGRVYVCNNGGFTWVREGTTLRPTHQPQEYKNGSIDVVDLKSGKVERMYDTVDGRWLKGPNDLVFDSHGGFYFTDLGKGRARDWDRGFIYYAKADGSLVKEIAGPAVMPNGIGLAPDGKTLYVAETETGRLWAWDILAPGELRKLPWPAPLGARLVCGPGGLLRFDSIAVTASGNICIAALQSCSIVEISADGSTWKRHGVPDLFVTNLCFGGKDLRTAFVTLSYEGRLAAMTWHEPGLRLNYQEI